MAEDGARKKPKVERPSSAFPANNVIDISSDRDVEVEQEHRAPHQQEGEHFKVKHPHSLTSRSSLTCFRHQTLQLLHGDFDALRQLITCKICERLLYEPFVLSCGHTYCYSCLSTWFTNSNKITCPNCRDVVKNAPAPSYLIKEMTEVFIARTELLPDGETLEQHAQWKKEEADIVNQDKSNTDPLTGGLFKGCFTGRKTLQPIHDPLDGVDRCPQCNWEVEDGMCEHCGFLFDDDISIGESDLDSDSMDEDEELDGDLDAEDDDDPGFGFDAVPGAFEGFDIPTVVDEETGEIRFMDGSGYSDDSEAESELNEDDEDGHSMQDFIDDGTLLEDNTAHTFSSESGIPSTDGPQPVQQPPSRRRNRRPVIVSSDDDESENEMPAPRHISVSSDDEEESDSGPEVASSRRVGGRGQNRQPRSLPSAPIPSAGARSIVSDPSDSEDDSDEDDEDDISDDEDDAEDDDDIGDQSNSQSDDSDEGEGEGYGAQGNTHSNIEDYGFSPMHSMDEESGSEDEGTHNQWR